MKLLNKLREALDRWVDDKGYSADRLTTVGSLAKLEDLEAHIQKKPWSWLFAAINVFFLATGVFVWGKLHVGAKLLAVDASAAPSYTPGQILAMIHTSTENAVCAALFVILAAGYVVGMQLAGYWLLFNFMGVGSHEVRVPTIKAMFVRALSTLKKTVLEILGLFVIIYFVDFSQSNWLRYVLPAVMWLSTTVFLALAGHRLLARYETGFLTETARKKARIVEIIVGIPLVGAPLVYAFHSLNFMDVGKYLLSLTS